MSSIYHLEPPTKGKVLIHTNYGDIDVELWAKETPLACRNFVQLALEGYYDDTLFHRIIRGFMIQGGDPTGTGSGGESIYGGEFRDEIHQRLRFTHRGIVAMANPNKPNSNTSQFFITLDACEHLKGKHTIFGKVTGDTIYNVVRIGDLATDMDDRPLDPVKITGMEVLWNPFDDVVPRDISESLKRRRATKEGEETEEQRREAKRKARLERAAKKDKKLLSFGDEEDDDDGGSARVVTGKLRSSHDVVKDDPTLRPDVDESVLEAARAERKQAAADAALKIKQQVASIAGAKVGGEEEEDEDEDDRQNGEGVVLKGVDEEAEAFAARMRLQVQRKRKLGQAPAAQRGASRGKEPVKSDEPGPDFTNYEKDLEAAKKAEQERKIREKAEEYQRMKAEMTINKRAVAVETGEKARQKPAEKAFREMLSPLEARRQKYLEKRRGGTDREADTLTRLSKFRGTLLSKKSDNTNNGKAEDEEEKEPQKKKETESYHGQVLEKDILDDDDDDDDAAWFGGRLKFKKHIDDAYRGGDGRRVDDYIVIHTKSGEPRKQQERRER